MNNRKIEKLLWITISILSPLFPIGLYFSGNWYSFFHSYSIGMVFGITSYVYFFITLLISSRFRYLDSVFGHDRVMFCHGLFALAAIFTAALHCYFKFHFGIDLSLQTGLGIAGFSLFVIIIMTTILFMSVFFSSAFRFVSKQIQDWIKWDKPDYSKLKIFHNFTVIAFIGISVHVLLASSTQENFTRLFIMGLCSATALSAYIYHKYLRAAIYDIRFIVNDIRILTPDIVEISMKTDKNHSWITKKHRAGQFGYFRFTSDNCSKEEHPFTISSRPGLDNVLITVKNLGDYTSRLKNIPLGAGVIINGPYGIFSPEQNGKIHFFIAGGIGITPFLSIISDWDYRGIKDRVILIWSVKNEQEMMYREYFDSIEKKNNNLHFVPVISRTLNSVSQSRHIDLNLITSIIDQSKLSETEAYICGPEPMRKEMKKLLTTSGILSGSIHYERFSL